VIMNWGDADDREFIKEKRFFGWYYRG
jgi:hypothetical protein